MHVALVLAMMATLSSAQTPQLHRKFEYKHSFRAPNLAQRDGTIPFWMVSGDAIASMEQLRLAPSMRSRRGIAWNKRVMSESESFEVEMSIKVTGQGRIGADGLAVWYTAQQGTLGPVFGSNDYWTGLGLMFDSFDNDGQKNNPFVSLMINDGTRSYDHHTDGSQQMLSGCQKDFRNKPFPMKVKIEYLKNVLTVLIHDGMTQNTRYEMCIRVENVILPKNGYFGLSAATGGLADDHDILEFSVYSLNTEMPKPPGTMPQAEQQKYDAEFEKQMQDYEKERQRFKEQHPDKAKDDDVDDFAKYFEDATARELRLIYESQNAIHLVMQQMEQKLQAIVQQQNQHTQLINTVRSGGAVQQQPATGGGAPVAGGGFGQEEKNEALQALRELTSGLRDMRTYVNEIYTRTFNMEQKINQGAGAQPQAAGQGQGTVQQVGGATDFATIKNYLESVQADVRHIRANQNNMGQGNAQGGACPDVACLTSTFFLIIVGAQSALIVVLLMFRRGQEKAKFY
uniref:L-type lectin-like domain-containing protein n=1 Tax=Plectus sambesii TaxID=2011161 RepID=A0A914VUV4_9BILA